VSTLAVEIFNAFGGIICDQRHKECNPTQRLQTLVVDTVQCRQSAFTSNYLKHIKERRDKLGLADSKSAQGTNDKEVGRVRAITSRRPRDTTVIPEGVS
jgi:hypothetical protein